MINLKNWKTDIKIKLPRFHVIREKHVNQVAEGIIRQFLYICFWLSWLIPLGAWKLYELIKPMMSL